MSCICVPLVFSFGAALALTPMAALLGRALGLVDNPDARKVHKRAVTRIGGIAIFAAATLGGLSALLTYGDTLSSADRGKLLVVALACGAVFLIGLLDDIRNLPAKLKLVVILLAGLSLCSFGLRIDSIGPASGPLHVELGILAWPATLLWLAGVTVALNFIDGLDGLAGGVGAIAALALFIGAAAMGQIVPALLSALLLGALMGFLPYNFNPAKLFMGDCGSMFLGFSLAVIPLTGQAVTRPGLVLLTSIALCVPLLDTFFTMLRRGILQRRSLFAAERGHIHHCLLDAGVSHRKAVLWVYGISGVGALLGLVTTISGPRGALIAALLAAASVLGFFHAAGAARVRDTITAFHKSRGLRALHRRHRKAFDHLQLQFASARNFEQWWEQVCAAGQLLGFASVSMPFVNRDGSCRVLFWNDPSVVECNSQSITFSLPVLQRRAGGPLPVEVALIGTESLEAAAQRVGMFFRLMEEHSLSRIPTEPAVSRLPARSEPNYQTAGGLLEPSVEGLTAVAS